MAAQARVLRVTTGGESPVIITARACLAPLRLLAQALVRPAGALRYTGPTWSLDRSTGTGPFLSRRGWVETSIGRHRCQIRRLAESTAKPASRSGSCPAPVVP
jgi:hypothetical protein